MRVSIITAVLNGAESISRTLDSVAQQDYPDIEHVIADGGSHDATLEIVNARRPSLSVVSGPDSGIYSAFNKGLRAATGEVVAYLNSGDSYESVGAVSRMALALGTPDVDAAFSDVLIVDARRLSRVIRRYSSKKFKPSAMAYGFMPAHPDVILAQTGLRGVGGV